MIFNNPFRLRIPSHCYPVKPITDDLSVKTHVERMHASVRNKKGCQYCTSSTSCASLPSTRRYCIYKSGPAGWSRSNSDGLKIKGGLQYEFMGAKVAVMQAGPVRKLFVLRHEYQHEIQRECKSGLEGSNIFTLLFAEMSANISAWKYIVQEYYSRFRWLWPLALLDCVATTVLGCVAYVFPNQIIAGIIIFISCLILPGQVVGWAIATSSPMVIWTVLGALLVVAIVETVLLAMRCLK